MSSASPPESIAHARPLSRLSVINGFYPSAKIVVDCDEDDFNYGIYD
jgi:hypothetical protein